MNYTKKMGGLIAETFKLVQYKRLPLVNQILMALCLLPLTVFDAFLVASYYISAFILKGLSTPVDILHAFVKKERGEVRHATEAVLYVVAMPFIFLYNIVLAMFSFYFYILWFLIMAVTYVITLGGIRWQPFVTEAEYDGKFNFTAAPDAKKANIITLIPALCIAGIVVLTIVSVIISLLAPLTMYINVDFGAVCTMIASAINVILSLISLILDLVFDVVIFVVIPVMFKLVPAEEKAEVEAPAEETANV